MLYLLLSIICGSALSIVMRISNGRVKSNLGMLGMNYTSCMLITACFAGFDGLLPDGEGAGRTIGLGMLNGVFYMTSLLAMQVNIRRNGVVLPALFSKMGALLVPLVTAVFLFGESPSWLQCVGFVLAVAAIVLMNYRGGGGGATARGLLLLLLLLEGSASAMSKVFREWGGAGMGDGFLLCTFGMAFALCMVIVLVRGERLGRWELFYGILVGIPNCIGARLVLRALEGLPAILVYPVRSVGNIVLVTLVGVFIFHERLSKRQQIALPVILGALILLNL